VRHTTNSTHWEQLSEEKRLEIEEAARRLGATAADKPADEKLSPEPFL
jgi:hypothetical protein